MAEHRATCMRHAGMKRADVKEAVLQKLAIGQQYFVMSRHKSSEEESKLTRCELVDLSRNAAVFQHRNNTRETFTYQEIWKGLLEGSFR